MNLCRCCPCDNNDLTWRFSTTIVLTSIYCVVEIIVGHLAGSLALIADSFHMLSDIIGLVVALVSHRMSKLPATKRNTFGWQRAEVVGTAVNTVILLTLAFTISVEALTRFIELHCIENPMLITCVGIGGLVINIAGMFILSGNGHGHSHGGGGGGGGHGHSHAGGEGHAAHHEENDGHNHEGGNHSHNSSSSPPLNALPTPPNAADGDAVELNQLLLQHRVSLSDRHCADEEDNDKNDDVIEIDPNDPLDNVTTIVKRKNLSSSHMGMRAAFLHVLSDALGSVVVIIVAGILWGVTGNQKKDSSKLLSNISSIDSVKEPFCYGITPGLLYLDPALSMILVILIFITSFPLAKKSILILLQSVPDDLNFQELKTRLETLDGVHQVHDLHVWRLQGNAIIASVHVRCININDFSTVSKEMKKIFHEYDIHCTTIQPEFTELDKNMSSAVGDSCLLKCGENEDCNEQKICCPSKVSSSHDMVNDHRTATNAQSLSSPPPPTLIHPPTHSSSSIATSDNDNLHIHSHEQ